MSGPADAARGLVADRRRLKNVLVVCFLVVLLNLPLALSWWTDLRVERAGVDVTTTVAAEGEVRSLAGLWTTLVADAVLLGVLLLVRRSRRRPIRSGQESEGGA